MGSHITAVRILVCSLGISLCIQLPSVLAVEVSFDAGRKLLQHGLQGEATFPSTHPHDSNSNNNNYFGLPTKVMAMVVPGVLILGCVFLCPCFQPKKKEVSSSISQKELNFMDSSSSFEGNSELEKAAAGYPPRSPYASRHPPSSPFASRLPPPSPSQSTMSPRLNRFGSVHLNFSQIIKATHNFSASLKIGEGVFGTVYKGQLPDGQWIAVKRAKKEHFDSAEFNREIEILPKIDHRNLVKLLGYVDKGDERLIVTEYVPNGTLREHLDGLRDRILDFNQRIEIAIDIAHGLTYLHLYADKQIIHRDVKSSNILLTENFRAKVADFGFARVGPADTDYTHISTKVKGTVGYLDPEYMKTYQLTHKSDVYSFGILLLEILTGRRPVEAKKPVEERVTIRWAINTFNKGDILGLVDPRMKEPVDVEILENMFCLAFKCAANGRAERPDMNSIGKQLWAIRMDYRRTGPQRMNSS